jgi:hypothetical protein
MASAIHALGHLEDLFMSFAGYDPALYSTHYSLSCAPLGAGDFDEPAKHTRCKHPTVTTKNQTDYFCPLRALGLALYLPK